MKAARRLISGALSLIMACSLCLTGLPAASAADPPAPLAGSLGLTLRFDLPQTPDSAAGRNIKLHVTGSGKDIIVPLPAGTSDIPVQVNNVDGAPLNGEGRVGYYVVELTGLPAGEEYRVELTGTGYKAFAQTVRLDGYSKHLVAGTGDGTFSLGDVNGDGKIDSADLDAIDANLGGSTAAYDLNGDGKVDITDLAYASHNVGRANEAQAYDTAAIISPHVDTTGVKFTDGDAAGLFQGSGTVTMAPESGSGPISLPIDFGGGAVEMSEIQITCPDAAGAIQKGQAVVEDASGASRTVPFDITLPQGIHAIGRTAGERVITIDLGAKVAVKKVTITVTATQNDASYAVVRDIEFLKDIVPESPKNDQVQNLAATPGNGQITLEWAAVHNVTGYVIEYGAGGKLDQQMSANSTRATVTGLENLKTYQFRVTAVNGDWRGVPSDVISAAPEPGGVPGAPSNISVTAADQSLRLSWGQTKDASYYQVFYRQAGQSAFTQYGGNLSVTTTTITGLTNGVTYQVAVKAGNSRGTGPYSATASGTPQREELVMPELPQEDRINNGLVESVVMTDPNNVDRKLCPGFAVGQVVDGDAATYWVAQNWSLNSHFTYTFTQPQDMNYVILVPYLGGNHKYALRSYTVTAKDSNGETLLSETLYYAPSMNVQKNYLVLPFAAVKGVKSLTISLNEREGNGCRVSISEMAFYKSDSLAEDIAALFADGTFTALKPGVTGEQISALSARLEAKADFYLDLARLRDELKLAQALLAGDASALGAVKSSFQSRDGSKDSQYGQSASALQPLGVTARAGATVAVYAQLPTDAPVYVTFTQFFGESGIWKGESVRLVNGRNYITVPKIGSLDAERGGPLYLTYAGANPEQIRLQVRVDSNSFAMPVLELSGWYGMDETARKDAIRTYVTQLESYVAALNSAAPQTDIRNATEISTPSVLLSIPASQALAGLKGTNRGVEEMVDAMYQNVLAWEDVLFVANKVQGIIPAGTTMAGYRYPMTTRQNIRYMRMFAGAFMYAAGSHVGVGWGSTTGLVCGSPVSVTGQNRDNSLFGWGIAHEIGHNMDKLGKAEITNNIYSLAVQAYDGAAMTLPTRLTKSNIWAAVYDKTSAGRPGSAGSVFVQLAMYWQLHLAYDNGDQPLNFFNQFFTSWKNKEYGSYTYDERVALIASKIVNRDLTEFFTRWGLVLSDGVKQALASYPAKEARAIWYLNDNSYTARLNGEAGFAGTVAVTAAADKNNAVLTITGGDASILGYEIRRNGKHIAFTTASTYIDDLGPANNLTYTYSVVPVDKLGNMGPEATAGEVRIAWDAAIDSSLYTTDQQGDTVTATLTRTASVTGVKIAGANLSGHYTVQVQTTGDWITVREGELSGNETVTYFTKPGADPAKDSRIWTYDVTAVRVTGLSGAAQVTLLDYPGDRVDFYPGVTVGRLQNEFRYGGNADQVIPAGTLVVVGTYRGDPAYNSAEVEVRYSTVKEAAEPGDGTEADKGYVERAMNGYSLLFAEVPEGGKVSDTSDGFWIFVPDLEAERVLNVQTGVSQDLNAETGELEESNNPTEIRAVLYRTDTPNSAEGKRLTSETLWISFPDYDTLPEIVLTGTGIQ